MLICHEWKVVFLHVPKCAGTAIRQTLERHAPMGSTVSFFDFEYNHTLRRHVDLAHLPLMDLRHYDEWTLLQSYHTIASIRHPYARLASACREFYRQLSRDTQIQMESQAPSREQLLAYLRALPAALEAHDLRYVHAFPITWFSHYGARPMVDTLLQCADLVTGLESLRGRSVLPEAVVAELVAQAQAHQPGAQPDLSALQADPDLQAMANVLHQDDFNTFGYGRANARLIDAELVRVVEQSLNTTASHAIPCISLAPRVRWYWGRDSNRKPPLMPMQRSQAEPSP